MRQRPASRWWSAAAAAAIALVACGENGKSIFIRQVQAPPVASGTSGCLYTADVSLQLSSGLVDAGLRDTYRATLLVGSQLKSQASVEQLRSESARLLIDGAEVHVFDAKDNELRSFTRLANATIEPGTGGDPVYGIVTVDVLDGASIRAAVADVKTRSETRRLVVKVSVFGHTLGGTQVETNVYQFPIDVCKGCLVSFPAGSDDPTLPGPDCKTAATTSSDSIVPCLLGQDQVAPCSLCQGYSVCEP